MRSHIARRRSDANKSSNSASTKSIQRKLKCSSFNHFENHPRDPAKRSCQIAYNNSVYCPRINSYFTSAVKAEPSEP